MTSRFKLVEVHTKLRVMETCSNEVRTISGSLLLILIVALSLRLFVSFGVQIPIEGDAKHYLAIAEELRLHHRFALNGEITAHRPPLYPLFLAAMQTLSTNADWIRFIQCLLSVAVLFLLHRLMVHGNTLPTARFAAVCMGAISPSWIYYSTVLFSETLFAFLLFLSVTFLMKAFQKKGSPALRNLVLSGFFLGLATLTRSVILVLPLCFLTASGVLPSLRKYFKPLLVVAFVWGLTLLPWTVRNAIQFHAFVPVNTMGGIVLWQGANPSPEGFGFTPWKAIDEAAGTHDEVERNRILTRQALETYLHHPTRTLRLMALKGLWFWNPWDGDTYCLGSSFNPHTFLMILLPLFYLFHRRAQGKSEREVNLAHWVPLGLVVYFLGMALLFYGSPRFRMPIEPVLWFYSGLGIATMRQWNHSKREAVSVLVFGLTLLLYLFGDSAKELLRSGVETLIGYRDFWNG